MIYRGLLYRAINPIWAREPMSGEGARHYGGRFNPKGTPALYTSQSIMTAIREANQVGSLQPTTLVSYQADFERLFDATDPDALAHHGITSTDLSSDDWRVRMCEDGMAPTQRLAEQLIANGHAGMQVRSFAKGATEADLNVVLWNWGPDLPTQLSLIDDERRLR